MKKDIDFPEVTGVKIAIAKSTNSMGESEWNVYLINKNLIALDNIMVVSKGVESPNGEGRKTSTLRHAIPKIEEQSFGKIEAISPEVFSFYNEFWVSFFILNQLFDKKFVIEPFNEFEISLIPEIELRGQLAV
ncbi:MAG: hypothetical protein COW03_17700 [Cytophagales bacterium CG12_big_fil_rev_8_21_14_0_65_40_12]|nr:MAG: hypothetical protein COW03_17700 [Cytophagales bacterium CG12_big_fil_rev_8_21_14_0_65_40_12]PIW06163.1 MAG: hypothetical protein COW40_01115 [Cytophagales bacterium CG17_big_fil_post_rev_8_21_14_2_50_40_13]